MGIKTTTNSDGSVNVSTTDGVNLVSNTYAQLSYTGGAQNGSYGNIMIQDVNPANGAVIGSPQALDPHLSSGSLKGMIDMRDQVLGGLSQSLGNLAQQTAQAFNAQSNANAAFPPPTSLTGTRHRPAFQRRAEFHRPDHHRGHRFQRQSGVAHRCEFRRRHLVGGRRRKPSPSAPPSAASPPR